MSDSLPRRRLLDPGIAGHALDHVLIVRDWDGSLVDLTSVTVLVVCAAPDGTQDIEPTVTKPTQIDGNLGVCIVTHALGDLTEARIGKWKMDVFLDGKPAVDRYAFHLHSSETEA